MKPTHETKELDYAIAILTRSSERAKDIAEMLDAIKDAIESLELAKDDLEYAVSEGEAADEIAEYQGVVESKSLKLHNLKIKLADKIAVQMSLLTEAVEAAQEATRKTL